MKKSISELKELSKICRGDILKMTYVSKSGHPGGSMSSIDIYLSVFNSIALTTRVTKFISFHETNA